MSMTAKTTPIPPADEQPVLSVEVAGRILGLGRAAAYAAASRWRATDGADGIPNLRIGRRVVVPTALLRRMLGLDVSLDRGRDTEVGA